MNDERTISPKFKGIWIPKELWQREDLGTTEKVLLAQIDNLDGGDGCFASDEYLSKFLGVSIGRLKNILVDLRDRNLIESISFDGRKRKMRQLAYRISTEVTKTLPLEEPEVTKTLPLGYQDRDTSSNRIDSKGDNKAQTVVAEEVYDLYPKKIAKQDAIRAIIKALRKVPPETLKEKVTLYADAVAGWAPQDLQFVPYPASWFNAGRYEDNPELWRRGASTKGRAGFL